jgi:hypothetical protein
MPTDHTVPRASSSPTRYYWPRTVAAAFFAGLMSLGVSFLGRSAAWSYSQAIAFGTFLFLIPVLEPQRIAG